MRLASKTRICVNSLLLPPSFGGIGNVTYHLLRNLAGMHPEWEFTLLIGAGTAPHFKDIPGIRLKIVGIESRIGRLAYLHLIFPFLARRYALLHSTGNMGLMLCPVPQIITIHDTYERVSPERFGRFKRLLMGFLISQSGRRARKIIAVSRNTRMDIEKYYPELIGKISVIYSGNKYPLRLNADADGRSGFLFVGTLEPGKNLPLVLRAFSKFRKKHPGKLRIAGAKGWNQSKLPELVSALGIGADLEFLGFVSDERLREEYELSLALIQASTYEGFGLPVIEAMACGCPVIAARNSGLIESGGDAALFFETDDDGSLAGRMGEIHSDRETRRNCIRAGLRHAAEFKWEKTAEETASIYKSLVSAG